jgi:hypothetical protein
MKEIHCEDSLVRTFKNLVNDSVQRTGSSHNLNQTYDRGSIDGVVEG